MSLKKFREFLNESEEERTYSFEELSPEAKEKALDHYRDINVVYNDWEEPIIEGFKEDMLEEFGVDVNETYYSGFHSQGDGASYEGEVDDYEKFFKNALSIKSSEFLDMGDEEKSDDEGLVTLMGDLRNIGFDTRERLKPEDFYIRFSQSSSRYLHSNTMDISIRVDEIEESDDDERDFQPVIDEIEQESLAWARAKADELYYSLYKYYEELQEDDKVKESILANEYKFDKDGSAAD